MSTDTSERGLERLICTALTGRPCDLPASGEIGERPAYDDSLEERGKLMALKIKT